MDPRGKASAKSFEKSEGVCVQKKKEGRRGGGKNQETYPVKIPRFVCRQFEFYYRRAWDYDLLETLSTAEAGLVKDERLQKFQKRNCKLQGALKRERKNSYGG